MFRTLGKSKIAFILAILFGISLFFYRQGSSVSNFLNSDNVIAKVGNTPISTSKFIRTLEMNVQNFNQILDKNLTGDEIIDFQIHQLALGALINDAIIENEFDQLNFKLDDKIIAKKTKEQIPQLYDKNNELNEDYLKQFLIEQRLKIEDIVQIIHFETRNNIFNETLLNIEYPNIYSKEINSYINHQRNIEYLKIPIKLINIKEILSNNENSLDNILSNFYQENSSKYMSDEKRDIEYIIIDKKNIISSFLPNENEIVEYYKNNSDLYTKNEKRSFFQFNFKSLKEAKEFKKNIQNINQYEEVILYANSKNIEYNNFENLSKDEVLDEIAQSLFSLNINEQSEVIESLIANHIIILRNIIPSKQLSLEEARKDISKTISEIDSQNYLIDLENSISQDILDGVELNQIANKYDLKMLFLKNLSKNNYKNIKGDELFINNIVGKSFSANLNFTNDIIKLNPDKFYIYKVVNIIESKPLNFSDIKNTILLDWKKNQKVEKIKIEIENNRKNMDFLMDIEKKYAQIIDNITIKSFDTNLPKQLIEKIFQSEIHTFNYFIDENNIHISKLIGIDFSQETTDNEQKISLYNEIRNSLNSELNMNIKISTNDNLLNSIVNNY